MIAELGAHRRVVLGTDLPTGNGVEPLGMLHLITSSFLSYQDQAGGGVVHGNRQYSKSL